MRAVSWVFAVIGGCALWSASWEISSDGDPAGAGWYLIGLGAALRRRPCWRFRGRGHPVAVWLLAGGSLAMVNSCLGDVVLSHAGPAAAGWVMFAAICTYTASQVAGFGLIGLFPTGRPNRTWQRTVLIIAAALWLCLLPVLVLVSSPAEPRDPYAAPQAPRPSPARCSSQPPVRCRASRTSRTSPLARFSSPGWSCSTCATGARRPPSGAKSAWR